MPEAFFLCLSYRSSSWSTPGMRCSSPSSRVEARRPSGYAQGIPDAARGARGGRDRAPGRGFLLPVARRLVKDERHLDRFDRVFGMCSRASTRPRRDRGRDPRGVAARVSELHLSEEDKSRSRLSAAGRRSWRRSQAARGAEGTPRGRQQWIGTGGTSPFGAYGYNPAGVRIGQKESRHRRAIKVWDKREFKDLDEDVELGTRNIKLALRRLRKFARKARRRSSTSPDHQGHRRERLSRPPHGAGAAQHRQGADVLRRRRLDGLARQGREELFSAARTEFKHLEYYYFHNCLYENVWRTTRAAGASARDLARAPYLSGRLQGHLRRRCVDEPLRDHACGRRRRAYERRARRDCGFSASPTPIRTRLAQSRRRGALALDAVDRSWCGVSWVGACTP